MPFRYDDLSGGGRHLNVTTMAQIVPSVGGLVNTQGAITLSTASPTSPGVYIEDPAAFFAPSWGSGSEVFTVVIAANIGTSTTAHVFIGWGTPLGAIWYVYQNASEQIVAEVVNTSQVSYMSSTTTASQSGYVLIHVEYNTGSVRTPNIYINGVLVGQTKTGPSGTPITQNGTERLHALSHSSLSSGNTISPVGLLGFKRGVFTAAEKYNHVRAFNAA